MPENYDEPSGATVSLPYLILPATGPSPSREPLVYLQGGPGVSTIVDAGEFSQFADIRADRDWIFLEQRGTGMSDPFLGCGDDGAVDEGPGAAASIESCYDDYVAAGVDPSQYTTLEAARDLAQLRMALDIERWHLLGISYGTTLAMVSMRVDPDGIASVILDSPTAPNVNIFNADVESALDVTARVMSDCENDTDCGGRYADLFDTHLATLGELADEPWVLDDSSLIDLFGTESIDDVTYQFGAGEVVGRDPGPLPNYVTVVSERDQAALRTLAEVGDSPTAPGDPEIADGESVTSDGDVDTGDVGTGDRPVVEGVPEDRIEAFGYTLSVYCAEDAPFFDLTTNPFELADPWPLDLAAAMMPPFKEACRVWKVAAADPADVAQVDSDIPTLILTGQYDPLTPIRQAEIAAAGLSRSTVIEVPALGHGLIGDDCARTIMVDFLSRRDFNQSCLSDIEPIEWR